MSQCDFRTFRFFFARVVQLTRPLQPVLCAIQVVRLGISGEPFFEIGEAIRQSCKFTPLWPLGYTNADRGSIPTCAGFPGGGYEVEDSYKYVGRWKIADQSEGMVVDAARNLLSATPAR